MKTSHKEATTHNKKTIDKAVERVGGAVEVAGGAVSSAMLIKDKALDEVEALKTPPNTKDKKRAIKKISSDIK